MNDVKRAVSCFIDGFSCSQAILSTYGPQFGISHEIAFKISKPFGGGIGRMGKICGAVTGALMVIGLKYGNVKIDDNEAKEKTYDLVNEFVKRFEDHNSTIKCKKLIKCDISTPEGLEYAKNKNLFGNICSKLVQNAAEILEQIL